MSSLIQTAITFIILCIISSSLSIWIILVEVDQLTKELRFYGLIMGYINFFVAPGIFLIQEYRKYKAFRETRTPSKDRSLES